MKNSKYFPLITILLAALLTAACGSSSSAQQPAAAPASAAESTGRDAQTVSPEETATAAAVGMLGDLTLSDPYSEKLLYGSYSSIPYKLKKDYGKEEGEIFSDPQFRTRIMYPGENIEKETTASNLPVYLTAWDPYKNLTEENIQEVYSALHKEMPEKADELFKNYLTLISLPRISMTFVDEDYKEINAEFTYVYTVEGNMLRCRRFIGVDEQTAEILYSDEPEDIYHFGFNGRDLILEQDGSTVTLASSLTATGATYFTEEQPDKWYYNVSGCIDKDENAFHDIATLYVSWEADDRENADLVNIYFTDGSQAKGDKAVLLDDHTLQLSWEGKSSWLGAGEDTDEAESVTVRFIDCGGKGLLPSENGCILIDEAGKCYFYQTDESVYKENKFGKTVAENTDLENMDEDKSAELAAKQDYIISQLKEGFEASGVIAQVAETTGSVRFDSNILFAVDSAEVSAEGKAGLDEFLTVYVPIMKTQAEEGLVGQILIDGHTDTSGTHDYNQDLSERRAKAVADYVTAAYPDIAQYITAKGYSFDKPVFAEDGTVDMDASRRVEFRFLMNVN